MDEEINLDDIDILLKQFAEKLQINDDNDVLILYRSLLENWDVFKDAQLTKKYQIKINVLKQNLIEAESEVYRMFSLLNDSKLSNEKINIEKQHVLKKYEYLLSHTRELESMLADKEDMSISKNLAVPTTSLFNKDEGHREREFPIEFPIINKEEGHREREFPIEFHIINKEEGHREREFHIKIHELEDENTILRLKIKDLETPNNEEQIFNTVQNNNRIPLGYELIIYDQREEIISLKEKLLNNEPTKHCCYIQ